MAFYVKKKKPSMLHSLPVDGMTENSLIMSSESKMPSKGKCFLTWKKF